MVSLRRVLIVSAVLSVPILVLGFALATVSAALPAADDQPRPAVLRGTGNLGGVQGTEAAIRPVADEQPYPAAEPSTTLSVAILSSPWATVDANDPTGENAPAPNVFVVQALVANLGPVTATDVTVALDYGVNEATGWILVEGEDPQRGLSTLGPGAELNVYWLARYPATDLTAGHRYTITASADNAAAVATADNAYGNPAPDMTVQTVHALSTGSSALVSYTSGDVVVGASFTVSVVYDLGSSPDNATFSPVGNPDFAAGAFRLISASVRLFNDRGDQEQIYPERLYFPYLPAFADNAAVTYTFLAVRGVETRLCSYADIGFLPNYKYDQFYCEGTRVTPITGTVEIQLDKTAGDSYVQQGEVLTYTIRYTNTGTWALGHVWVWDDIDPAVGSVMTLSITPPSYDQDELDANRVAWYIGDVPIGAVGTLTYAMRIDGGGDDLADGLAIVNHAYYGVSEGTLPAEPALTTTVTTTVQAPALELSKTDYRPVVQAGERLTYTLVVTNHGSIAVSAVVLTDLLPVFLVADGPTIPITDTQDGQILVWNNLGSLLPPGGTATIMVPCRVLDRVPNDSVLTNRAIAVYRNSAGHTYAPAEAEDTTTVQAPILDVSKRADLDPIENGALLTFTLTYTNYGPSAATGVIVTDRIPISTTYVGCAGGLSCHESAGLVTWLVGTLPAEATGPTLSLVLQTSPLLQTGDLVTNDQYGILSDQTPYLAGPPVWVTVVRPSAAIEGHAFVDEDGDGLRDIGEIGLAGITVTLAGALDPVAITDGDGFYSFRVEVTDPVSVTATLPDGFFRTTPGQVWLRPALRMTYTADFGYASLDSPFAVIYGTVFEDGDYDGRQAGGESGLSGVMVASAEALPPTVATNHLGQYTLVFQASDSVTITETNPPLYVSTTPDTVAAQPVIGSSGPSPVDFGDVQGIRISGRVFHDLDVDGMDDAEPGIAGVTVWAGEEPVTTAVTGDFTAYLPVTNTAPITVAEVNLPGYLSTNALPGPGMSYVDADTMVINSPAAGTVYYGSFGDVVAANVITITGAVWDDNGTGGGTAGNGLWDGQEPALPGATIELSSGLSSMTLADGAFALLAPAGLEITVLERNPTGYVSTGAIPGDGAVKIDDDTLLVGPLGGGSTSSGNLFGDTRPADVALSKWAWPDPVVAGSALTYTVHAANHGPAGATGVIVTDSLPAGVTLVAFELSQGSLDPEMGVWDVGSLAASDFATMTLVTLVDPEAQGLLVNAAEEIANTPDPDSANNSAEATTAVVALADLAVTTDDWPDPVAPGGVLTYTLTYTNEGPSAAQGITITDLMAPELVFGGLVAVEPSLPGFYQEGSLVTWNGPAPAPGEMGTIVFTVTVRPDAGGVITNGVTIASITGDDHLENNADQELTTVGVADQATIYGWVFDDHDGDGVFDPAESGIPGVTVELDGQASAETDADGLYTFLVDSGGIHVVIESDPAGYYSTTPNEVHAQVSLGSVYRVDFGDALPGQDTASIFGTVFDDLDSDGEWDFSEPGIPAVLLTHEGDATTTNEFGSYHFVITSSAEHTVIETDPEGTISTTPNTVTITVEFGNGYEINFGDVLAPGCSCPPDSFEDDDTWQSAGALSPYQVQAHDFCDDAGDWTAFEAEAGAVYTLTTLSWGRRADTFLTLYDTDGQTALAANDDYQGAGDYSSRIVWQAPTGGVYYVQTTNRAALSGCLTAYDLWLEEREAYRIYLPLALHRHSGQTRAVPFAAAPAGVISHSCPDAYEIDDTWEAAQPLVDGLVQIHSFDSDPSLYSADKDWLGFDLWPHQAVTVTIVEQINTLTLLEVFDGQGDLLARTQESQLVWQAQAKGHYYVAVSPLTTTFGCADSVGYSLVAQREPLRLLFLPIMLR